MIFVSNNCGKTVKQIQNKFKSLLNIDDIPAKNIITSAVSTAIYLKNKMDIKNEKVFVAAQDAFTTTLNDYGIQSFGVGPVKPRLLSEWKDFEVDPSVKYVIISYDPYFTHTKLTEAYLYITENNADFMAPDVDTHFSVSPTRKVPGSMTTQASVSAALMGRKPIILGKPHKSMFDLIQEEHGKFDLARTLMVGDNYQTDVKFGFNCGISTALVLTGNTKTEDVQELGKQPDYVLDRLWDVAFQSE